MVGFFFCQHARQAHYYILYPACGANYVRLTEGGAQQQSGWETRSNEFKFLMTSIKDGDLGEGGRY
jgi:hypothetical protein